MKEAAITSLGLCLLLFTVACGTGEASPSGADLLEDTKGTLREITAILVTMQDEPSAEAATEKLLALTAQVNDIRAREEKLSPDQFAVNRLGDDELKKLRGAMIKELMRLSTDETLAPYVEEAYAMLDE